MKYEYQILNGNINDLIKKINETAINGWRMHTINFESEGLYVWIVMERQVVNE